MYDFWYFPDIKNSDELIMNHPETETRINAGGARDEKLSLEYDLFNKIHSTNVNEINNVGNKIIKEKINEYINRNK